MKTNWLGCKLRKVGREYKKINIRKGEEKKQNVEINAIEKKHILLVKKF